MGNTTQNVTNYEQRNNSRQVINEQWFGQKNKIMYKLLWLESVKEFALKSWHFRKKKSLTNKNIMLLKELIKL